MSALPTGSAGRPHKPAAPTAAISRTTRTTRLLVTDERPIYLSGTTGPSWRILRGSVRLSRRSSTSDTPIFAGIAQAGDILGSEVELFGSYACDAFPLGEVELEAWLQADTRSLLQTIAAAERRTAEAVSLRAGEAVERVRRLFSLLAGNNTEQSSSQRASVFIPSLRDMAEITDLKQETVSRIISQWRHLGLLTKLRRNRGLIVLHALQQRPALAA